METSRGKVITFYSYKGGTGRSMALANTACLLAKRSDVGRVLAIDWDLDAPGLHHYFRAGTKAGQSPAAPITGVLEVFEALGREALQSARPLSEKDTESLVSRIDWTRAVRPTGVPNVDLLPAGLIDDTYASRVADLDWRGLFAAAPSVIRLFAEAVARRYDYVLVDSRTGLNDISGICTTLMPDTLVLVFTPNSQSIDGGLEVVKRATSYRRESSDIRPLVIFPLQSRLEMSEPELLHSWRFGSPHSGPPRVGYQRRFESLFTDIYGLDVCDLQSYFDEVQIQHVPRYSYGEEVAAVSEPSKTARLSLSRSYAAFADILTKYDTPWSVRASIDRGADLVAVTSPTAAKVALLKEYLGDDRSRVRLHDLVTDEVRTVVAKTQLVEYQGQWSVEQFQERLKTYEGMCNDLVHLEVALAYWADSAQEKSLAAGPKQVGASVRPESGLTLWLTMRWYPAMLLAYAGGVAAVAGGRYENLKSLLSIEVQRRDEDRYLVQVLGRVASELHDAFKRLPGFERRHTPRSDYLCELLEPIMDSVVFIGADFQDTFDRFEIILALEYMHRENRPAQSAWAPPGRYGWRSRSGASPVALLIAEFEEKGATWEPLRAGLFGGSADRFVELSNVFREFVRRLPFY